MQRSTTEIQKSKTRYSLLSVPAPTQRVEAAEQVLIKYQHLGNLEVLVCDRCKTETPRLPRLNDLMRTVALAVIAKPYVLEGQDIRFLRKFLGLTNEAFAAILDIDKSHLSRVENGATPVSSMTDRLVRLVALGLGDGLDQKAGSVIARFTEIQKPKKLKLMVDASTRSYQYKAA